SIFMFVLFINLMGLIPYSFTVTTHIVITASLALMVFFTVIIYGLWKNGLHFFKLFVPSGVPIYILPLVTAIEVMSFLSRPVSHSREDDRCRHCLHRHGRSRRRRRHHLRPLSRRRAAQSVRRPGPVRQPDLRLRGDRGARHLLAADRAPAAVRAVIRDRNGPD